MELRGNPHIPNWEKEDEVRSIVACALMLAACAGTAPVQHVAVPGTATPAGHEPSVSIEQRSDESRKREAVREMTSATEALMKNALITLRALCAIARSGDSILSEQPDDIADTCAFPVVAEAELYTALQTVEGIAFTTSLMDAAPFTSLGEERNVYWTHLLNEEHTLLARTKELGWLALHLAGALRDGWEEHENAVETVVVSFQSNIDAHLPRVRAALDELATIVHGTAPSASDPVPEPTPQPEVDPSALGRSI